MNPWTRDMIDDLQLAAELGKTLLERNKDLETSLKQYQTIIEDQALEIEHLSKQTSALKEVNNSRLRIYEQLEINIQDLERENHELILESTNGKKQIRLLAGTIESLESKCDDLDSTVSTLRSQLDEFERNKQRIQCDDLDKDFIHPSHPNSYVELSNLQWNNIVSTSEDIESINNNDEKQDGINSMVSKLITNNVVGDLVECQENEQISCLLSQIEEYKQQSSQDSRKIIELEQYLARMIQQNETLTKDLDEITCNRCDNGMKSMHEELSILEEVRQGQMCSYCLRPIERHEMIPDDDDSSIIEELMSTSQHHTSLTINIHDDDNSVDHQLLPPSPSENNIDNAYESVPKVSSDHLYADLVRKYESLLRLHRNTSFPVASDAYGCKAQIENEDKQSCEFEINSQSSTLKDLCKPLDISSSSNSFERCTRETQTDVPVSQHILSDNSSELVENRFNNCIEYQQLFKEIFNVLKKQVVNNTDANVKLSTSKSLQENLKCALSVEDSITTTTKTIESVKCVADTTKTVECIVAAEQEPNGRVLVPLVRQPLDYISVQVRTRSNSRRRRHRDRNNSSSTATSPPVLIGSPKITYSNRRVSRSLRKFEDRARVKWHEDGKLKSSPTALIKTNAVGRSDTSERVTGDSDYCTYKPSLASQELNKLKNLDKTYAQVLRNAKRSSYT